MGTKACLDVLKKRKIILRIRTLDLPARNLVNLLATLSWFPKITLKIYIKKWVERCEIDSYVWGREPAAGPYAYGDKAWVPIKVESFANSWATAPPYVTGAQHEMWKYRQQSAILTEHALHT
jgi:hypothetical protein